VESRDTVLNNIIIIQYLCSALKSCKGYRGADVHVIVFTVEVKLQLNAIKEIVAADAAAADNNILLQPTLLK